MRPRSSWLPRSQVACSPRRSWCCRPASPSCTRPSRYYPYECPIGSGGTDFDGNGSEGNLGLASWDPRTGLWFSSGQGPDPFWGTWGDIPTPGDFNGDGLDDVAIFRPSTGTWLVRCSSVTNCPEACWRLHGARPAISRPGRLRLRRNHRLWRVATEQRPLVCPQRCERRDAGQRRALGSVGDCPIAANLTNQGAGPM